MVASAVVGGCPTNRDDDDDNGGTTTSSSSGGPLPDAGRGELGDAGTGGRIPGCLDDDGIDLFAVEGDTVLALSWNNHTGQPATGGYRIIFGAPPSIDPDEVVVPCTTDVCEHTLTGLQNDVTYTAGVQALGADAGALAESCSVSATPHVLRFAPEIRPADEGSDAQANPSISGGRIGVPLLLAWAEGGAVRWSMSTDLGDSWTAAAVLEGAEAGAAPSVAMLDRSDEVRPSFVFVALQSGGNIRVVRGRGNPDGGPTPTWDPPVDLGPGTLPSVAVRDDVVVVAFENANGIHVARSEDDGESFGQVQRVDTGSDSHAPSVALDANGTDVYVGFHGKRGRGDDDIYLVHSADGAETFGAEVRVDDDAGGNNQRHVSLAVDARTDTVLATWEDRRNGADVYFANSLDLGESFEASVNVGVGLNGDQTSPRSVADPGRNVYVLFIDSSNGQRAVFSRFNAEGGFDPPLTTSSQAGTGGAAAREPAVFVDAYGTIYATWSENRGSPTPRLFFARAD
ncbi:MAG: sialidase family protein [Myxococcota bacterium]